MSTKITIADIAAEAGVSVPTVSKVLNQRADVSASTRRRVELIIAQRGYIHSRSERAEELEIRRTNSIGRTGLIDLIVPDYLNSDYHLEIIHGFEEVLNRTGQRMVLYSTHINTARVAEWSETVSLQTTDGAFVFISDERYTSLETLLHRGIPLVVIDDTVKLSSDIPSVGATNWAGALAATEYLITLGHRRIGAIGGNIRHLTSRARVAGYRAALEAAGIAIDPSLIRYGDFHHEGGYVNTLAMLDQQHPPTAIFAGSDLQATGVYRALHSRGMSVPKDVSVIGFDDLPTGKWITPPLTTVRQPLREMGHLAANMLNRLIRGEKLETSRFELATSLVVRESCAPPLKLSH